MHMPIGWEGLSMPTDGYFVCINFVIINCKLKGAGQDSVPYMMEVIRTHISVTCEIVDPYVDRFLNGSG